MWSVVHVPSVEADDTRHLHRQLGRLKVDRTRHISRIKGLLASQGVDLPVQADSLDLLETARLWNGAPLPPGLQARVKREYTCLQFVQQQIRELETERAELIDTVDDPSVEQVGRFSIETVSKMEPLTRGWSTTSGRTQYWMTGAAAPARIGGSSG